VDPRLGRAVIGLASLAALAAPGDLARAGQPDQAGPGPPPAVPPSVLEQQTTPPPAAPAPGGLNALVPAPGAAEPLGPPPETGPPTSSPEAPPVPKSPNPKPEAKPPPPAAPPPPPPGPPPPVRSPTAILQVLDKVTAETLKFEAPVGRPIRYKTLVFTVRVCETRGADDPQPRPSAYVVIDSEAPALPGHAPPPARAVFRGWMFAEGPGLHPLEHPIYDAWLVACSTAAPAS